MELRHCGRELLTVAVVIACDLHLVYSTMNVLHTD